MIKSPSLDIVKSFGSEEFKRFIEFLKSPYFNKNSNLVKMAEYFKKIIPADANDKLTNEKIWKVIYGKKEFNYGIMKNLVYEFKKITEKFLAVEYLEKDELSRDLFIINELKLKVPGEIFEKKLVTAKNKIENSKTDIRKLYFIYELNSIDTYYKEDHYRKESDKLSDDTGHRNSLISFFFASIFHLNYNQLINSKFLNTKTDLSSFRDFLELYENKFKGLNLLSELYYYAVKMMIESDNSDYYQNLKELVYKNYELLGNSSLNNFVAILTAYCQLKKPGSKINNINEEFEIQCFALGKGLFDPENFVYFDSNLFSRLVELSILLDKPDWCREFIDKYKKRLSPVNREIRTQIAEIYLQNHLKNYEYALEILSKSKPDNIIEKFKIRSIELMIFFNLKDYERVYTLIKNFRSYLEYDGKVSELTFIIYAEFLNYTRKLTDILVNQYKTNDLKNELDHMLINFDNVKIANKTWLRSVIKELQTSDTVNIKEIKK